jgi:hypothetical protein
MICSIKKWRISIKDDPSPACSSSEYNEETKFMTKLVVTVSQSVSQQIFYLDVLMEFDGKDLKNEVAFIGTVS